MSIDTFSLLNYQGSKKKLIEFIYNNCQPLIDPQKAVLDIFSGSGSVGYGFKRNYTVYANDSEYFSYIIELALLSPKLHMNIETLKQLLLNYYQKNRDRLLKSIDEYYICELEAIKNKDFTAINDLYRNFPTVWNQGFSHICMSNLSPTSISAYKNVVYSLFTTYYASSYFGINQAIDIDSIRYAIDMFDNENKKSILLCCLFYAMKECVFSKDGHMAQPLNPEKYASRMLKQRSKSIIQLMFKKLTEFLSNSFVDTQKSNKAFNLDFVELLTQKNICNEIGFVYADPPYTDMQYSRYYHLLNTIAKYDYPELSINNGKYSVGLYTVGRFQSKLSQRSNALQKFTLLMDYCKKNKKNLAISFAYPRDTKTQKADRYVMKIDDIIQTAKNYFTVSNIEVKTIDYSHSNNRNSEAKKVLEYLILCKGR